MAATLPEDGATLGEFGDVAKETVESLLADLSLEERAVLILTSQGHSIRQIADGSGLSEHRVYRLLSSATRRLAKTSQEQKVTDLSATLPSPVMSGLINAVGRFTPGELDKFVGGSLTLHGRRAASVAPAREFGLLLRVFEGLPADLSRRLVSLHAKRDAEALTSEEHEELIRLGDEVEERQASRLEALSELAALRRTTLAGMMSDLGLTPVCHG